MYTHLNVLHHSRTKPPLSPIYPIMYTRSIYFFSQDFTEMRHSELCTYKEVVVKNSTILCQIQMICSTQNTFMYNSVSVLILLKPFLSTTNKWSKTSSITWKILKRTIKYYLNTDRNIRCRSYHLLKYVCTVIFIRVHSSINLNVIYAINYAIKYNFTIHIY